MSHIPNSAMKHAGPKHHDENEPLSTPGSTSEPERRRIDLGTWLAIGGTIAAAAVAIALPLLRGDRESGPAPRNRKENGGK
jgi:hypothetical protein